MRLKAYIQNDATYKKAIIYESPDGVYLFLYDTVEDRSGVADQWFESVADAQDYTHQVFGLMEQDWEPLPDPLPGAQHDWEQPTRVIRHTDGAITFVPLECGDATPASNLEHGRSLDAADSDLIAEIQALLQKGHPIAAIQRYRQGMGVGLREAKAAIERLIDRSHGSD
jgi:biofilm protein TabA